MSKLKNFYFPLVQFSRSVMSDSLPAHGLQHTRLPCPSQSPRVCSNSCPLSWWCHPTISSSVTHFFCLQSLPASGSFLISQLFQLGGQSTAELQLQHQAFQWIFRVDLLQDCVVWSHAIQGTLKSFLQHHSSKASVLQCSAFFIVQLLHTYMTTGKAIPLTRWAFIGKVMSLLLMCCLGLSLLCFQGVSVL